MSNESFLTHFLFEKYKTENQIKSFSIFDIDF
jgi:hypothetical protein